MAIRNWTNISSYCLDCNVSLFGNVNCWRTLYRRHGTVKCFRDLLNCPSIWSSKTPRYIFAHHLKNFHFLNICIFIKKKEHHKSCAAQHCTQRMVIGTGSFFRPQACHTVATGHWSCLRCSATPTTVRCIVEAAANRMWADGREMFSFKNDYPNFVGYKSVGSIFGIGQRWDGIKFGRNEHKHFVGRLLDSAERCNRARVDVKYDLVHRTFDASFLRYRRCVATGLVVRFSAGSSFAQDYVRRRA